MPNKGSRVGSASWPTAPPATRQLANWPTGNGHSSSNSSNSHSRIYGHEADNGVHSHVAAGQPMDQNQKQTFASANAAKWPSVDLNASHYTMQQLFLARDVIVCFQLLALYQPTLEVYDARKQSL